MHADFTIVTGAPGTGKTTLLNRLDAGIGRVAEPAREVLAHERATGGTGIPDQDPARFVALLPERSIANHERQPSGATVVFDRGVPDCIAYAELLGIDAAPSLAAAQHYRYRPEALLLRPWREIYTTDDERRMTFEDMVRFHEKLEEVYRRAGYRLVDVPRGSVAERTAFVTAFVRSRPGAAAG